MRMIYEQKQNQTQLVNQSFFSKNSGDANSVDSFSFGQNNRIERNFRKFDNERKSILMENSRFNGNYERKVKDKKKFDNKNKQFSNFTSIYDM